ncbi:hypothetical protein [Marinitenerispora sediminis]|uniref:Uncharacterized protein n=1 Tax=Marinitenerispora sediminis TaxID=1931232 RepID=A0A368SYA4_9ACTN|nr:hypothetical protein [Marinitenerispora sediminis]RCV48984.1 hypothetical protein DEF24_25710 [Marinitenerispora sediminis]RCV50985.1 hypothetical protein DEF23_21270 [Marinitenerispora sediminis]RCV53220.1 hypothetical protein DEF28_10785 [Marinitenerispora sediminis]
MGAFLSALPQWLQLGVWGLGLISSASLTAIFGAKSYVSFQTDRSKRALLTGETPKRAKYFPGTGKPIADVDLVPQADINEIQRQIDKLKTAVRPAERDLERVKKHTGELGTLASRLGERSTAYDRIDTALDDILKAATEGQEASKSSSGQEASKSSSGQEASKSSSLTPAQRAARQQQRRKGGRRRQGAP